MIYDYELSAKYNTFALYHFLTGSTKRGFICPFSIKCIYKVNTYDIWFLDYYIMSMQPGWGWKTQCV